MISKNEIINEMIKAMFYVTPDGEQKVITPMRMAVTAAYEAALPLIEANFKNNFVKLLPNNEDANGSA